MYILVLYIYYILCLVGLVDSTNSPVNDSSFYNNNYTITLLNHYSYKTLTGLPPYFCKISSVESGYLRKCSSGNCIPVTKIDHVDVLIININYYFFYHKWHRYLVLHFLLVE